MNLFVVLFAVSFIRTILIIAVIYYAIRLFSKYIAPILLDKGVKKMQQKMQNQQRQNQKPSRPEGEVTIESDPKDGRNDAKSKGEYVDFEEVE